MSEFFIDVGFVKKIHRLISYGRSVSLEISYDTSLVSLQDNMLGNYEEIIFHFMISENNSEESHWVWTSQGSYILVTNGRILLTTAEDDHNPDYIGRRVVDAHKEESLEGHSIFSEDEKFFFAELFGLGRAHELRGVNEERIIMQRGELLSDEKILLALQVC